MRFGDEKGGSLSSGNLEVTTVPCGRFCLTQEFGVPAGVCDVRPFRPRGFFHLLFDHAAAGRGGGGGGLVPMENLLRGMWNSKYAISLEIYAKDRVVGYCVRCNNGASFNGMFHSYYPQAHLTPHSRAADQPAGE